MIRLSIVGPKTMMKQTIDSLHDMKLLHIDDYLKDDNTDSTTLDIGSPLEESAKISKDLVKLRSIKSLLPKTKTKSETTVKTGNFDKHISEIESSVSKNIEELKSIDEKRINLESLLTKLEVVESLGLDASILQEYDTLDFFIGHIKDTDIKDEINKITDNYNLYDSFHKKKHIIAIFIEKNKSAEVLSKLNELGFSEIDVAGLSDSSITSEDTIKKIRSDLKQLNKKKEDINKDLASISDRWSSYIDTIKNNLNCEAEKAEAPLRFSVTENAFIVEGWIPAQKYSEVKTGLESATDDKIFIKKNETIGNAPIKLDNKGSAKSFGFFMDMYSLPSYKEIDPTFFMFLMFPIFFGFMLGDWGYGLLTLTIFTCLRYKIPKAKDILTVLSFSSVSTIIFGLLYDEFFGIELFHEMGIHFPNLLVRSNTEGATQLLIYALALGILHISTGYIIGFINELKEHGLKTAILEKLSWIIYMAGFFPTLIAFFGMGDYLPEYRSILLMTGIVLIVWGEGIKGILELISPLTNALSYARLMAVGLASVILAEVVNEMTHPMFASGIFGIVLGTILLIAGHTVNICLGLMSPFIHSMRLHYVEFFLKFYHGGGKKYTPFGIRENL